MQRPLGKTPLKTVLQQLISKRSDCSGGLSVTESSNQDTKDHGLQQHRHSSGKQGEALIVKG